MSAGTVSVVALALLWAVTAGVHDAGTLTASGIASRALSPRAALVIVGVFGFTGPLVAGTAVADTIASTVDLGGLSGGAALRTVAAALLGAMAWNVNTWRLGIPATSTHGLVGGLVGATVSSGLAGYCYTQLTDTLQEQNGLTSADRVPKVPIESLRAIFGQHGAT